MKICEENVRAALDQAVGGETLSTWDKQRIVRTAEMFRKRPAVQWSKRLVSLTVTAALAVVCAGGVMAAGPDLARTLGMLSRQTLQFLRPVQKQCEDAGVQLNVIAAMNDGDTAVTYVELQDTTGQNRLDATTQAPDLMVNAPDYFAYVDNVYQREDDSLVLRVVAQSGLQDELAGQKATLSMNNLLTGGENRTAETGFTVADIQALNPDPLLNPGAPIQSYDLMASVESRLYQKLESGSFRTLKPLQNWQYVNENAPWARVLNVGVVDGVLHILVSPEEGQWYNRLTFRLVDAQENWLDLNSGVIYWGDTYPIGTSPVAEYSQYQEYLIELPVECDPASLRLVCDVNSYDHCISGEWQVTFHLQPDEQSISVSCDMDMKPWRLTEVQLSPMGLTMVGTGSMHETSLMPEAVILLENGAQLQYTSCTTSTSFSETGEELILVKCLFDEPIDPSGVQAVKINGRCVWARSK
ncbi:MAG: hypothetical protein IJ347_02245 [Faecalibacterium sp.]|nr:hypothetical protein [Faecalibacterium sp.]